MYIRNKNSKSWYRQLFYTLKIRFYPDSHLYILMNINYCYTDDYVIPPQYFPYDYSFRIDIAEWTSSKIRKNERFYVSFGIIRKINGHNCIAFPVLPITGI